MLRSLVFYIVLFIATICCGTAAMVSAFITRRGNLSHLIGRLWGRILLFASGVKVRVDGLHNIDPDQAYVFAANQANLTSSRSSPISPSSFAGLPKKSFFAFLFSGWV